MLRSMYSGISGLRGFQTKLDVIGNNIANVNTSGYKKGRAVFQDMMSQTMKGSQPGVGGRGGINPMQVGLGSQIASIDNIHTQGFRQSTGNPLDFAIQGDGMFILKQVPEGGQPEQDSFYTRAGNFYLDDNNAIVNADGYYLMGFQSVANASGETELDYSLPVNKIIIPDDAQSFSVAQDGSVNYIDANGQAQVAGQVALARFSNPAGLEKLGNSLYRETPNAGLFRNAGTDVVANAQGYYVPGDSANGIGNVIESALEMSNVDLAEEFTEMIVAQRGFQANTRIITTSDEVLQELVNLKR